MTTEKIDFRHQIKEDVKTLGISLSYLARKSGIHAQTLYNFLAGRSEMQSDNLSRIINTINREKSRKNPFANTETHV